MLLQSALGAIWEAAANSKADVVSSLLLQERIIHIKIHLLTISSVSTPCELHISLKNFVPK